jgi:Polysaccharide lyase
MIAFLVGAVALAGSVSILAAADTAHAAKGRFQIGLSDNNRALTKKRPKPAKARPKFAQREPRAAATPTDVLFRAERLSDFWLLQSAPGAITEAPDPAGSGQTVFKMTVKDGDVAPITPTENPRAEMLSFPTIRSGDEIWFSSKFFLPASFPSSVPGWMNVMQGPYGPPWNGPPPWHLEVNGSNIKWTRNSTYNWDVPWQMPLVRNSWVSVTVHERFGPDGWIEMWVNGQPITFFGGGTYNPNKVAPANRLSMATMDQSNSGGPNYVYLQSYRKVGMLSSVTSYAGPLTIGQTKASVEI